MNNFNVLNEFPLIRSLDNFLSEEECIEIINFAKKKLVPGEIINEDGMSSLDADYRSADISQLDNDTNSYLTDLVYNKVSNFLDIDKHRFEDLTITHYSPGQHFKIHQDYFVEKQDNLSHKTRTDERCKFGGNRISTVIIYLNDVSHGGETYFPWVDCIVKPEQGKLMQFDYNYDDNEFMNNVKSQHIAMPVITGDKWIITIWIREFPRNQEIDNYKKFSQESNIYNTINDVNYILECGDENNKQLLNITLPGNDNPMNTIIVGFTGGLDSSLLLYLVGSLNNYQTIPYIIQPVCITSRNCYDQNKIYEDWENVELMQRLIQEKVGGNIKKIEWVSAPRFSKRSTQSKDGLLKYFRRDPKDVDYIRFRSHKYIFTGDNIFPQDGDEKWKKINYQRVKSSTNFWKQPLFNLEKYHIIDAILKLGLEDLIEKTSKGECADKHADLYENCDYFACNERRWAFTKLNKKYFDIGNKYFIKKDN
jgi:prolyl 4-hydroxylase